MSLLSTTRDGLKSSKWGKECWDFLFITYHPKRKLRECEKQHDRLLLLSFVIFILWCKSCRHYTREQFQHDLHQLRQDLKSCKTEQSKQAIIFSWLFRFKQIVNNKLEKSGVFQFQTEQQALEFYDAHIHSLSPTYFQTTTLWMLYLTSFNYPPQIDLKVERDSELYEQIVPIIKFFLCLGQLTTNHKSPCSFQTRESIVEFVYHVDVATNGKSVYGSNLSEVIEYFETVYRLTK